MSPTPLIPLLCDCVFRLSVLTYSANLFAALPNVRRVNPFQEEEEDDDDDDDDLDLLREVVERRRHRAPRLPTWASKAVEEGKLGEQRRTGEPSSSAGQGS